MVLATNRNGFSLLELLVSVAVIGILVAIAIPQFGTYRMKAHNSAAFADLRSLKQFMEAARTDIQTYPTIH